MLRLLPVDNDDDDSNSQVVLPQKIPWTANRANDLLSDRIRRRKLQSKPSYSVPLERLARGFLREDPKEDPNTSQGDHLRLHWLLFLLAPNENRISDQDPVFQPAQYLLTEQSNRWSFVSTDAHEITIAQSLQEILRELHNRVFQILLEFEKRLEPLQDDLHRFSDQVQNTGKGAIGELFKLRNQAEAMLTALQMNNTAIKGFYGWFTESEDEARLSFSPVILAELQAANNELRRLGKALLNEANALFDSSSNLTATIVAVDDNRTATAMAWVAVFSIVFLPLSYLTGLYGMNFTKMPELEWKWGYRYFWMLTGILLFCMLALVFSILLNMKVQFAINIKNTALKLFGCRTRRSRRTNQHESV